MVYKLDADFTALAEKEGTLFAAQGGVEAASGDSAPERGSGIFLDMGERAQFSTTKTLYARSLGASSILNVQEVQLR